MQSQACLLLTQSSTAVTQPPNAVAEAPDEPGQIQGQERREWLEEEGW